MASQTMAVQTEMPTTVRLSEYLKEERNWGVAMLKKKRKIFSRESSLLGRKKTENLRSCCWYLAVGSQRNTYIQVTTVG